MEMDIPMQHLLSFIMITVFGLLFVGTGPLLAAGTEDTAVDTPSGASAYDTAKAAVDAMNYAAAKPLLVQLTLNEPANADAWNLLGYSNRKLGMMDEAALAYETALKLNPEHLGALEYQGEMFVETGMIDKAKNNLELLKTLCGDCEQYEDLEKALGAAS